MPEGEKRTPSDRKANRGPSAGPENRRALIAAAREVFAADGLQAPFSAVAKKAGVGQGSLYRHFPDRLALAVAVFDGNLGELEAAMAPPDATLDDLLEAIVGKAVASTALIDLIWLNRTDGRVRHLYERLSSLAAALLAREHDAGRIADHVESQDVMLAVAMLADVVSRAEVAERPEVAQRARAILHAAFSPRH